MPPNSPIRTCLGCRRRDAKSVLLRLVLHDGRVALDQGQRLPGRGGYLHPGCAELVIRRRSLGPALRGPVDPAQVREVLESIRPDSLD